MPSPFTPIADYAFLSDCHTGALIAPDGADRLAVRAALRRAERVRVAARPRGRQLPARAVRPQPSGRRATYEPGTNVLVTTWRSPGGWVVVRDALTMGPRRQRGHDHAAHAAAGRRRRRPHARPHGRVHQRQRRGRARLRAGVRLRARAGGLVARRATTATSPTRPAPGRRSGCRPTWRSGSRATGCARGTCCARARSSTARCRGRRSSPRPRTSRTRRRGSPPRRASGAHWVDRARIPDHEWREPIQRSALAIKGLTYMPTGATVAALTTSLPETPGGERNWDYRFTWIRDSTFTLQALHWLNLDWEADEYMQFVADLEANDDGSLQIMYGIDGRRDLTETTRDDLSGYVGARPVRVGNGAFDQRQNDVYGAALDSILLHTRRSERLPRRLWPIVQAQAEGALRVWREPDQGIWEARGAPQHYVSSKLMCWVAMDRAAKLAEIRGDDDLAGDLGRHGGGDQGRHPRARRRRPRRAAPALRDRGARRLDAAGGDLRLPARRRRAAAGERAGDRRRADRARLRAALQDRRDRRRPLGQGGHVPDLLVLARLGARGHRRAAARSRPDGAPAARSRRRSGSTPRSSTPTPAATWGTSRRRSRTWP